MQAPKSSHLGNDPMSLPLESLTIIREAEPSRTCYFSKLPLKIKNEIYRMLLTAQYCARVTSTKFPRVEFDLCTNLLLANKEINTEATRVLLEENDFAIFKTAGLPEEHTSSFTSLWRFFGTSSYGSYGSSPLGSMILK
jgi:hypothetical protein